MGYIGQASQSESSGTSGATGDQTGKEINKKAFYKYPWHTYLECTDSEIAESAADYVVRIANDDSYGYSQANRWTGYNAIKANDNTVKGAKGDFDCSSLVIACYILAGLSISADGSTTSLKSKMLATGKFKAYTDSTHTDSDAAVTRGAQPQAALSPTLRAAATAQCTNGA